MPLHFVCFRAHRARLIFWRLLGAIMIIKSLTCLFQSLFNPFGDYWTLLDGKNNDIIATHNGFWARNPFFVAIDLLYLPTFGSMTRFILVVFGNIVYSGRDLPSPFCSIYYTAPIGISEHELDSSGFKYLLFSPRKFGEDVQPILTWRAYFSKGLVSSTTNEWSKGIAFGCEIPTFFWGPPGIRSLHLQLHPGRELSWIPM